MSILFILPSGKEYSCIINKGEFNIDISMSNGKLNFGQNTVISFDYFCSDYFLLRETAIQYGDALRDALPPRSVTYSIVDEETTNITKIYAIYNDFIGYKSNSIVFHIQQDGTVILLYDALTFIEYVDNIKTDPSIKVKNRENLIRLAENMTENDNPILLIGKMKIEF